MRGKPEFGFVVEYVRDIEAAMRFYVEVVGLKVERYHPTFVQFEHFAIASDAGLGGGREPEVYWLVDNAQAAFDDLSRKAEVVVPLHHVAFGTVFGIKDPDGQPLYMLEFAANRPSRLVAEDLPGFS